MPSLPVSKSDQLFLKPVCDLPDANAAATAAACNAGPSGPVDEVPSDDDSSTIAEGELVYPMRGSVSDSALFGLTRVQLVAVEPRALGDIDEASSPRTQAECAEGTPTPASPVVSVNRSQPFRRSVRPYAAHRLCDVMPPTSSVTGTTELSNVFSRSPARSGVSATRRVLLWRAVPVARRGVPVLNRRASAAVLHRTVAAPLPTLNTADSSDVTVTIAPSRSTSSTSLSAQTAQQPVSTSETDECMPPSPILIGDTANGFLRQHHHLRNASTISVFSCGSRDGEYMIETQPYEPPADCAAAEDAVAASAMRGWALSSLELCASASSPNDRSRVASLSDLQFFVEDQSVVPAGACSVSSAQTSCERAAQPVSSTAADAGDCLAVAFDNLRLDTKTRNSSVVRLYVFFLTNSTLPR